MKLPNQQLRRRSWRRSSIPTSSRRSGKTSGFWSGRRSGWLAWGAGLGCLTLLLCLQMPQVMAQSNEAVQKQEDEVIREYSLPSPAPQAPVVRPRPRPAEPPARSAPASPPSRQASPAPSPRPSAPARPQPALATPAPAAPTPEPEEPTPAASSTPAQPASSQYVLQFNRSPVVGNALQLGGVLSQARLGFTRPRNWQVNSAKVLIRFRHSPALVASRSNLTVRLNNSHLGSLPLNRKPDEIGNVLFDVPANLIQDYNTLIIRAQQHTSEECTDPTDPTLWTEILPDSQVVMNYQPQDVALDFANFPYPFLDDLGLEADQLTYLRPKSVDNLWLTAAGRFQAAASRLTNFRAIETRLVNGLDDIGAESGVVVLGTPAEQPALAQLALPFAIKDNKVLDGSGQALPNGVGVLMLTTTADGSHPVLVATGNDSPAVLKAVQMLAQPVDRQLATGQAVLVNEVADVPSPAPRDWPGYLPAEGNRLQLSDLLTADGKPYQDITVNGLPAPPPISIPLHTLPDDQFLKGSNFTLRYSYGPNIDTRRSSVTVRINGQGVGGERLSSAKGGSDSITVEVPPAVMSPTSTLEVQFFTYPQTAVIACGEVPDQPMWATVHGDSSFNLQRTNIVQLPDLRHLQVGFPLAAPQDLSQMAFVLPDNPSDAEVLTLLQVSGRLGRLSQADSVKLGVYLAGGLPNNVREQQNLVGIGLRNRFPIPEVFQQPDRFSLGERFLRRQNQSLVQTLPDNAGVIQAVASPWSRDRILLGLTGQSEQGLADIRQLFRRDELFSKLEGDTVLVKRTTANPAEFSDSDFAVTTLTQNQPREINRSGPVTRTVSFMQANWFLLPTGLVLLALIAYGVSQLYLNRISKSGELQ
ncbi:cellulose biosynthesis cyclic di-GMP-binding regulatory protein BcsB [Pseudanabaena sp. FACHB-2040]|uniref:cellulose biosynthesis cyclic di-GMP-binding regulatory protein BcsB n=1 Tax=Pseudanabaena sp. FACHB-2040 TaxID=2692859 RepID=UPI0018F000AE|nr:cellulose biosynthesis cyclic di-GMP-binding regulatory protein BcsB [Pseudanabaena sp. FACHB-2040]